MDVGVRLATNNPALAQQFRRAMDSWATILDLSWHEDDTQNCALEVVDGKPDLFEPFPKLMVARSQLPDRLQFKGWIAFNPAQTLSDAELYSASMHEIGHVLGLQHSSNASSVMYGLSVEGPEWLDPGDLAMLATRHKLRVQNLSRPVLVSTNENNSGSPKDFGLPDSRLNLK